MSSTVYKDASFLSLFGEHGTEARGDYPALLPAFNTNGVFTGALEYAGALERALPMMDDDLDPAWPFSGHQGMLAEHVNAPGNHSGVFGGQKGHRDICEQVWSMARRFEELELFTDDSPLYTQDVSELQTLRAEDGRADVDDDDDDSINNDEEVDEPARLLSGDFALDKAKVLAALAHITNKTIRQKYEKKLTREAGVLLNTAYQAYGRNGTTKLAEAACELMRVIRKLIDSKDNDITLEQGATGVARISPTGSLPTLNAKVVTVERVEEEVHALFGRAFEWLEVEAVQTRYYPRGKRAALTLNVKFSIRINLPGSASSRWVCRSFNGGAPRCV